jgi:alkanesulfonate monooxygenase SsuD/methylene tetrahydromethanopterin reductase-like flavin-dependent oxidoreductase (luciferase family)
LAREAELRSLVVLGQPDEVAERLLAFERVAGGRLHFVAEFCWPGLGPELQREALAVFADVIQKLAAPAG